MLADKVREYGVKYGMGIYSTSELIALMTGMDEMRASQLDMVDLQSNIKIKGVGQKKLMQLMAVREYANRLSHLPDKEVEIIYGPDDAADLLMNRLKNEQKEHFVAIMLNMKNKVLAVKTISVGTLSASVVHPREVFYEAILSHAAAIIVAHNHPSGEPKPSLEDKVVTKKLIKAGKLLDIPVLDHVIIGDSCFQSLRENSDLEF